MAAESQRAAVVLTVGKAVVPALDGFRSKVGASSNDWSDKVPGHRLFITAPPAMRNTGYRLTAGTPI